MFIGVLHDGSMPSYLDEIVEQYTKENLDNVVRFTTIPAERLLGLNLDSKKSLYGMYMSCYTRRDEMFGEVTVLNCLQNGDMLLNGFFRRTIHDRVCKYRTAMLNMDEDEISVNKHLVGTVNKDNALEHLLALFVMYDDIAAVKYTPFVIRSLTLTAMTYPSSHLLTCYANAYIGGLTEAKKEIKENHRKKVYPKLTVINGGK